MARRITNIGDKNLGPNGGQRLRIKLVQSPDVSCRNLLRPWHHDDQSGGVPKPGLSKQLPNNAYIVIILCHYTMPLPNYNRNISKHIGMIPWTSLRHASAEALAASSFTGASWNVGCVEAHRGNMNIMNQNDATPWHHAWCKMTAPYITNACCYPSAPQGWLLRRSPNEFLDESLDMLLLCDLQMLKYVEMCWNMLKCHICR